MPKLCFLCSRLTLRYSNSAICSAQIEVAIQHVNVSADVSDYALSACVVIL